MGKVSQHDKQLRNGRQKRRSRNGNNKYLKPGALAQLRNTKASASKSCTDLGKKRVAVLNAEQTGEDNSRIHQNKNIDESLPISSTPVRFQYAPVTGPTNVFSHNNLLNTPKTPHAKEWESESRLESLPIDLLVKILCHLHHDQLRASFHVSQKIRKAVTIARQFHFNYTTPDRSRQEMLNTTTPLPNDHWPFMGNGREKGMRIVSPHTPKAPKHGTRPPSRLKLTEMRQIAAVLFQEKPTYSSKCLAKSVIPKPICKNRVLFYEDELCQAVAQNKLR